MIEVLYWLCIVDGLGPKRISKLIEKAGDVSALWTMQYDDLVHKLGVTSKLARRMIQSREKDKIINEIKEIKDMGISMLGITDCNYPAVLKTIHDPPIILYGLGNMSLLCGGAERNLGVVGTRKPTPYGLKMTQNIVEGASKAGLVIVSGMAKGIDACAHGAALVRENSTIAVLGCGVNVIYPQSNKKIYEMILNSGGVILSEFQPGVKPLKHHFPRRNRIISALSRAVLVIEAGKKSGSLITAQCALDQGKDVLCVPGNVTNPLAQGCFDLLKEGAVPTGSVNDVLELFEISPLRERKQADEAPVTLEKVLAMNEPATADEIASLLGVDVYDIMLQLTVLEVKGRVKREPGGLFICTR